MLLIQVKNRKYSSHVAGSVSNKTDDLGETDQGPIIWDMFLAQAVAVDVKIL